MLEANTFESFKDLFSCYGYPSHLVTDNFQSFVGQKFKDFAKQVEIRHTRSPSHHPATNGAAENLVDMLNRKVKCILIDGFNLQDAVKLFLLD